MSQEDKRNNIYDAGEFKTTHRLPRNLWTMALTELWERFSFYGIQGILPFYLFFSHGKGGLDLGAPAAAGIVGAYGGAVYLAQLAGAWLGERVMSPRSLVLWGGVVLTLCHLALAIWPGLPGLGLGLMMIVFGTGALKTNITSIVGFVLDDGNDTHRDIGFAYFYMAINIGAVVGPLSTGFVQNEMGFHWGFALAAVGMVAALIQYMFSFNNLPERARIISNPLPSRSLVMAITGVFVFSLAVGAVLWAGIIPFDRLSIVVTVTVLLAAAAYFIIILRAPNVSDEEKTRVKAFLPLFIAASVYFGLLFQQFTSIAILISERVDLHIGDWQFPIAWVTMISQLAAVIATPLLAAVWRGAGEGAPGAPAKFAIGLFQIGLAYLLMLGIIWMFPDTGIPLLLIILVMIIAGSSEIFIGPIGLSLATKIGPPVFRLHLVGLNFLTLALGASFSGLLGQLFAAVPNSTYFIFVASIGGVLGWALWIPRKSLQTALNKGL